MEDLICTVLEKGRLLHLATVDDSGPWVSDVIYVHDDALNLYWLSMPEARHSQAILKNTQVAGTVTISTRPQEPNEALQISGVAEKIEGDILEMAIKHRSKRNRQAPLREGEVLEEKGQSWYKLTPEKILLNYEPIFGREHQEYTPH